MPKKARKCPAKPSSIVAAEQAVLSHATQETAAKLLGISPGSLRALRGAPRLKSGRYDLFGLLPWFVRQRTAVTNSTDDPLMAGGDSDCPQLRRYRQLRGDLLELELGRQRGELMSRESVLTITSRWSDILRLCHQRMQRDCGNDSRACELFEKAIDACAADVERLFATQGAAAASPPEFDPDAATVETEPTK